MASYCEAKSQQGTWLVRIDDLDTTRCRPEYTYQILKTLESFSLHWDESLLYQSEQNNQYQQAVEQLNDQRLTYPCACTRKALQARIAADDSAIYDGYCLSHPPENKKTAIRLKFNKRLISFEDALQGIISKQFDVYKDDIIIHRKDDLYAYPLAVCIDDNNQKINHVLRGADLLYETSTQVYIQQLLHLTTPTYSHIPVIINNMGAKLSKQTFADDISREPTEKALIRVLSLLKLEPPADLINCHAQDILLWAIENWTTKHLATKDIRL